MSKGFSFEEALAPSVAKGFSFEDALPPLKPQVEPILSPEEQMMSSVGQDSVGYRTVDAAKDIGKLVGAGAVTGSFGAPEAIEAGVQESAKSTMFAPSTAMEYLANPRKMENLLDPRYLANKVAESFNVAPIFEQSKNIIPPKFDEKQRLAVDEVMAKGKIPQLRQLTDIGENISKGIRDTVSDDMKLAMAESQPTGNILKAFKTGDFTDISMGANPSFMGLAGHAANVFGTAVPAFLTAAVTKKVGPAAAMGFGQAGSEAVGEAREHIKKMSDEELSKNSPYFANLLVLGYNPKTARQMTEAKAGDTAAMYQGMVGALGGAFTSKLIHGAFDKTLLASAKSRLGKIAAGTTLGTVEGGVTEFAEGVAADLGIDKTVVREIGVDSFANLVLGALGEGAPGVFAGFKAPVEGQAAPQVVPNVPSAGAPVTTPIVPTTPLAQAIEPEALQRIKMRLDQMDNAEVPLVGRTINPLAKELGLNVPKGQRPEQTYIQIKEALGFPTEPVAPTDSAVPESEVEAFEVSTVNEQLIKNLRENGQEVSSRMDAEKRLSNGQQIYGFLEQDEKPKLITSVDELNGYTPDQLIALPESPIEPVVAETFPMGENSEYMVVKNDNGWSAVLFDKDANQFVTAQTWPTEQFGEEGKDKAIEFAKEQSEKAAKYLPQEGVAPKINLPIFGEDNKPTGESEEVDLNPNNLYFENDTVYIEGTNFYHSIYSFIDDLPDSPIKKALIEASNKLIEDNTKPKEETATAVEEAELTTEEKIADSKARQEERFKAAAEAIGNDKKLLEKELREAKSALTNKYQERFKNSTYDFEKKQLISADGKLALQWENNGKTSGGTVIVIPIKEEAPKEEEKVKPIGGPSTPKKVAPTEEEKQAKEEEKKAAEEEKAKKEEQKKKVAEFNTNPMKIAMETGNADAVATLLYGHAVDENLHPVIFPEEMLLRIPVESTKVGFIEEELTKNKFRITDRSIPATTDSPDYVGPARITISALYNPEKVSVQGGGAQFFYNRKGQITATPLPPDATDKQKDALVTELLDLASPKKLLDIQSNPKNTFGAMMFKEGLVSKIKSPGDYLFELINLNARNGGQFNTYIPSKAGNRQAIKLVIDDGKEELVKKLLVDYVTSLQNLQAVLNEHSSVTPLYDALMAKYVKDQNADRIPDIYTPDGVDLKNKIDDVRLYQFIPNLFSLFSLDENSTDQTNRIVKKDAETPPELGNIIRRGMRDHRQGRDVDVQDFLQTFKFFPGGIDFGNWVNQSERAAHLNAIYDAMYDLADIAGIAPEMLGLNEKLKLAVGAQGRGGKTAAHFVPGANEINLTKTKGDGSLGHEWQHALDSNLKQTLNGRVLMADTGSTLQSTINVERVESNLRSILTNTANSENNRNTPPKKAFFDAISNSRYGEAQIYSDSFTNTQFYKDALALDKGREKPYWSTPVELLSRSFESLIFDLSKGGSPYLVGPTVADGYVSKKNGYLGTSYPAGKERPIINEIYQQMLDQIDPETLKIKTYKLENKIIQVEDLGYVVVDQYYLDRGRNGGLNWFKTEEEAKEAKEQLDGKEEILTPRLMQISKVNQSIINMAQRIDAIMEEMGLFKWPEIKNGSMAESMFYHMRQGWWPKNNRELAEYGIKAYLQAPELLGFNPAKNQREIDNYKIADFEGDRVKLKQTQEDFEAAAVRFVSQVITDMRSEGSDTKAIYDHIVGLYENQPSLDVKSVLSVSNNAYSTPLPIAYLAGMLSRVKSTTTVLDPTGGNGMLVVTANPKNVTTIEIDQHRVNNLQLMQMGDVIEGDALVKIKDIQAQKVDVVLANPPFGSLPSPVDVMSWTGQNYKIGTMDQLIAAESLRTMANDGRAVLLLGSHTKPNTVTSTDKVFLNWLYSNYNVADHFEIAGNLYRKQGASFPLRVLVIAGRSQTDNVFPNDFVVNRLTSFDELWSRYVQTSDRSEQVVVGTRKQRATTSGADRPSGAVPTGDNRQDGEPSGGVGGAGEGTGIGEQLSPTGGVNVPPKSRGPGTAGGIRDREQQQDSGEDQRGGPRSIESSTDRGSDILREESGDELGGLSDLELDALFDDINKSLQEKETKGKREKQTGGSKKLKEVKEPSAKREPKAPSVEMSPEMQILVEKLRVALAGKAPQVNKEITEENSQERLDKQADEAMGRIAQNTKNTSNDPNSGLYSRKGDQEYANVKPIIQEIWDLAGKKISDFRERVKYIVDDLVPLLGKAIVAHVQTFINGLRTTIQKRPKNQTPIQSEPIDTESRVVYLGKSRFASDGIYLPRAQAQHAYTALENLEVQVGNIDEFVAKELGYSTLYEMAKGLSGYQIDVLGLTIQANKLGKGFIIGDDTGVGKGRTAAAMIVWAKKQGKIPIFVSLSDSLYTDMYRDLINIGHGNIKIGMTNGGTKIIKDIGEGKTETVFQNKKGDDTKLTSYISKNKKLPPGVDVLFTNYTQVNGGAGSAARQSAVATLVASGDAVLVMDEAHNAAGTPSDKDSMGQNAFFMSLLTGKNLLSNVIGSLQGDAPENWKPPPTVYLSATFAKRPDNMPLYIHTNLRYAADTPEDLTALFGKGVKTDVLQQVSSEMLVESGSMIRRERSYEGVTMDFVIDDKNTARDTREVDKVTEILRSLVNADRALKEWIKTPEGMDAVIKLGSPLAGKQAFKEVKGTPFTAVVHNYIGSLLLSTKTQTAVDMVVDKLNNNEKVVVGLQSTNGKALEDFVKQNNIKKGDEIPDFGWQTLIRRAVSSTKKVTLKSAFDKEFDEVVFIPNELMPKTIRAGYENVDNALENFQSDLPAAPIDFIRTELEQKYVWTIDGKTHVGDTPPKGVKARNLVVKEITGRKSGIDYSGNIPKYITLDNPSRTSMISSYQNGEESKAGPIDVLIINSAGATGISLHASVDAFDQRQRHLIVLQPHGDISVFIQLLGRIHRTGQVEWPSFTMLATGIPAERRILAMLRKKLSSLKSNTSGGSSSTKVEGVDFINMYGDVSTAEYLNEHPDIQAFLDVTEYGDPAEAAGTDLAHKASGRAGLLSSADQKEFFDSIEASYIAEIDLRNATGTNALERRVLPLEAEIIKENLIEEGLDSSNPFLTDVVMAQFNVDIIGSIPTVQNIKDDISLALNGRTAQEVVNEIETELSSVYIEVRNQIVLKQQTIDEAIKNPLATEKDIDELNKQKTALDDQFSKLNDRKDRTLLALSNTFAIGNGFDSFMVNSVPAASVVVGIKVDKARIGKSKTGNPYSPSNFQIIIKRNIPEGRISPTLATLEGTSIERSNPSRNPPLEDWFALKSVTGGRTTRYIALGNILKAAQLFGPSGGEIAKFTLKNSKEAISGVVMPAKYVPVAISEQPVKLRNAESAVQYLLAMWNSIVQRKYNDTQTESYKELSDRLKSLMLPNLPNPYDGTNNNTNAVILRGSTKAWQLRIDSYRPNNFTVSMSGDVPKKVANDIKKLIPGEFKKSKGTYEMESGVSLTDPEKIIALVKFLHKNYPATVEADNATFAREVMKVEFDDSESKKGLASRGPAEGGQTVEAVQAQVVPIKGITVNVLQSVDELPDNTAPADVEGMWLSGNTVYLIADNLPNAKRVQEVLAHEAIGHALLEEMLGPKLMADLVRNVQNLEKTSKIVREIATKVDRTQPGLSPERRAKEIVANMAERGMSKIGLLQRVIQAIRNWLRSQGFTINFSDGDIVELLNFAENYFDRKEKVKFPSLETAQVKTQAEINKERQKQKRENAVGYFSRDAKNIKPSINELLEKHDRNHTPVNPDPSTLDKMMGIADLSKIRNITLKDGVLAVPKMVGQIDRGITYIQNKNIWYGKGLESADIQRYGSELRDGNNRAIASIAVTNAIHSGHIGTRVLTQGAYVFDPVFQMFRAQLSKYSMANVVEAKAKMVNRLKKEGFSDPLQEATDIINQYLEAKRSKSIINEYLARQETYQDAIDSGEGIEIAAKQLKDIERAFSKITQSDEAIEDFGALNKEHPELNTIMENWTKVNQNQLDIQLFSGLISKARHKQLKGITDYVPWQRIMDDMEDLHTDRGAKNVRGLTNVAQPKAFQKGKTERQVDDILHNMIVNVVTMSRNSARNYAANRVAQEYATRNERGRIKVFPKEGVMSNGAVRVNIVMNGRRVIVEIKDPLIAESVLGMESIDIPMNDALAFVANGLRRSVTINPIFQLKQMFMDAPTAAIVSGVKHPYIVWADTFNGFIQSLRPSDPIVNRMKDFGVGGYQSSARSPEKEVKLEIGIINHSKFSWLIKQLDRIGDASDYAQRRSIYKRVLKETGDPLQAMLQANNVIDFLKRGSAQHAQFLSRNVSFMNAYAQQINVLAETLALGGLKGNTKKEALTALITAGGLLAATTLLYAFAVGDDDEYNQLDDQTKMRNYFIPKSVFGKSYLIPMNTSAAYFFKAVPEMLFNKIKKEGTKNSIDSTRLAKALKDGAYDALLGPNPIPTAIKPGVEIMFNHNFLTGGSITPRSLQGLEAFRQYTADTSELGKMISAMTPIPFTDKKALNPIEADHFIRSLTGTVGAAVMWGSNMFSGERVTPEDRKNPLYGAFVAREVPRGREDLYYDLAERANEKYNTFMSLNKPLHTEEAKKYFQDNKGLITAHGYTAGIESQLKKLNAEIRRTSDLPSSVMSSDAKRVQMTKLQNIKNNMLKDVIEMRKRAGL